MAKTLSTMLALGTQLPAFALREPDGTLVTSADFAGKPLLVMFICNHCPYVIHVRGELAKLGRELPARGVAVVAINANDPEGYPADAPDKMAEEKRAQGYAFPYLFDAEQSVAKAFEAACTPELYLFDAQHRLVYRGQLDDSRPSSATPVTGRDLRAAVDALLAGKAPSEDQKPSMGCNIKWRRGNAPAYFG